MTPACPFTFKEEAIAIHSDLLLPRDGRPAILDLEEVGEIRIHRQGEPEGVRHRQVILDRDDFARVVPCTRGDGGMAETEVAGRLGNQILHFLGEGHRRRNVIKATLLPVLDFAAAPGLGIVNPAAKKVASGILLYSITLAEPPFRRGN